MPLPPLNAREQKFLLDDRIYWRLYNVHSCRVVAGLIKRGSYKKKAVLTIGDDHVTFDSFKEIAWPTLDIGIITGRVLMQFLGIYYSKSKDRLETRSTKSQPDDLTIVDLGLPVVQVDGKTHYPPGLAPRAAKALLKMLKAANQGIGHLTRFKTRTMSLTEVIHACEAVHELVNQELYVPLRQPVVTFSSPQLRQLKTANETPLGLVTTGPTGDGKTGNP